MSFDADDPKLTAYALGELDEAERREIEARLENDPTARRTVEEMRSVADTLQSELAREESADVGPLRMAEIQMSFARAQNRWRRAIWRGAMIGMAASVVLGIGLSLLMPTMNRAREVARVPVASNLGGIVSAANPVTLQTPSAVQQQSAQQSAGASDPFLQGGAVNSDVNAALYLLLRSQDVTPQVFITPSSNAEKWDFGGASNTKLDWSNWSQTGQSGARLGYVIARDLGPNQLKLKLEEGEVVVPHEKLVGPFNTESYDRIIDNPFLDSVQNPLSTLSIDVDTASYSNIRRFLNQNQLPPRDAVRIEEMVNYFTYDYPAPRGEAPFSSSIEIASCPWNPQHRLVRVGLKGKEIATDERGPTNLVFLIDVSGSMQPQNKLPLLKRAMSMLVNQLTENDRVAIVVYAGSSGLVLSSTSCEDKGSILNALDHLEAGGSTNGGQGIELAYQIAAQNFIKGGINRVILCTDGDFNVGITDQGSLTRLIEERATTGVFLSVLGFGMGNVKDSTMEKLADKGNGNYAYIDTLNEAKKVLVEQMNGTLVTIAKDVKIQIEFNPAQVQAYRLIGYENRMLAKEDFNDDRKDAGEIGAGHTVTALYEVVPAPEFQMLSPAQRREVAEQKRKDEERRQKIGAVDPVDPLKYQEPARLSQAAESQEMLTLKLRYKQPDGDTSKLLEFPVKDNGAEFARASQEFKFAASVAAFGMILRDSPHKGQITLDGVIEIAEEGRGQDQSGYRTEFIELVRKAKQLMR